MAIPVIVYMIALWMFVLYFKQDTPETRARLPYAYMAVIVMLFFQAVYVPVYLITAKKSVSQKYLNMAKKAQGHATEEGGDDAEVLSDEDFAKLEENIVTI